MTTSRLTRVRFYVDALNLYHGVARRYGIKWIDIEKLLLCLAQKKVPNAAVEKIVLFTAVTPSRARKRQRTYLSALRKHSPSIEVVKGYFKTVKKTGKVVQGNGLGSVVTIETREEKRTDVNLACRIVEDAFSCSNEDDEDGYDIACLVSNDSDIAYALEVKKRLKQESLLISPIPEKTSENEVQGEMNPRISGALKKLVPEGRRIPAISRELVAACQLPDTVGIYTKPQEWS